MNREEVTNAVAQAWTMQPNTSTVMDADLAATIIDNILAIEDAVQGDAEDVITIVKEIRDLVRPGRLFPMTVKA